jgi:DNA polymerase-4
MLETLDPARAILHVDMDAFFASIEIRDDPSLAGKPVLVGGGGRRGVVAAASYEARKYGCHSAQPTAVALRKCPQAVVVSPRHGHYVAVSHAVFEIFERYTPLVEGLSIDEAFLDITGTRRLHGTPREIAESIRAAVHGELDLTCSVGIASVKFVAKIASAANKPDGLTEVLPGQELEFLHPLPVGKLWGVGPRAQERLQREGIFTVGDLAGLGRERLEGMFGQHGTHLHNLAHAIDERAVVPGRVPKSISHEDTYADDLVGEDQIRSHLLGQATRVADRLVRGAFRGRKIQIKIRDTGFHTQTRQCTLSEPTDDARVIYARACELLDKLEIEGRRFRLTGVGVGAVVEGDEVEPKQLELLEPAPDPGASLQKLVTSVRDRYGKNALYPAAAARPRDTGASVWSRDAEGPEGDGADEAD